MSASSRKPDLSEKEYIAATLARINGKNARFGCDIVHMESMSHIDAYLKKNPRKLKIGFLVKGFAPRPGHYTPIYFERDVGNQQEYFVQLDSTAKTGHIPVPHTLGVIQNFYYSPFVRQTEPLGCMEDGVKILSRCFQENNLISFCKQNSLLEEPPILSFGKPVIPGTQNKFKLTSLPSRFLVNIEHYATLRNFKKNEPDKFEERYKGQETVFDHILRKGKRRSSDNPEHKDDFKGKSFFKRKREYELKAANPRWSKKQIAEQLQIEEHNFIEKFNAIKKMPALTDGLEQTLQKTYFDLQALHNKNIGTPLHVLMYRWAEWGMPGISLGLLRPIDNFIFRGVSINAQGPKKTTILTQIFREAKKETLDKNISFIKELIARKADPSIKDSSGKSAFDYACKKGCSKEILDLLRPKQQEQKCLSKPTVPADFKTDANTPPPEEDFPIVKLLASQGHEQEYLQENNTKQLCSGVGLLLSGLAVFAASAILLAVTCGAHVPLWLGSLSLIITLAGVGAGLVAVPLVEACGAKNHKNARIAAGTVVTGAGLGAATTIPVVSSTLGIAATNVAPLFSMTTVGSAVFMGTMIGVGAGFFAAFVLVVEGIRLIRASRVSQNPAAMFSPARPENILAPSVSSGKSLALGK